MTPKEFAVILRNVQACHEASYDKGKHRYKIQYREAARLYAPAEWARLIECLLISGYSDIWEWCDEVEAEPTLTDRIDLVRAEILDED